MKELVREKSAMEKLLWRLCSVGKRFGTAKI
jgi:hypothetical protein